MNQPKSRRDKEQSDTSDPQVDRLKVGGRTTQEPPVHGKQRQSHINENTPYQFEYNGNLYVSFQGKYYNYSDWKALEEQVFGSSDA